MVSNEYYSKWLRHSRTNNAFVHIYARFIVYIILNWFVTLPQWLRGYYNHLPRYIYARYIELRACEFVILSHCIVAQQDINNIIVRALCSMCVYTCNNVPTKPLGLYLYGLIVCYDDDAPRSCIYAAQPNEKKTDFQAFLFVFRHTFDKIIEYFPNTFVIS